MATLSEILALPATSNARIGVASDTGQLVVIPPNSSGLSAVVVDYAVKNNYDAVSAPTPSDNSAQGYTVGSKWYDTSSGEAYLYVSEESLAAVWVIISLTVDELGSAAFEDASSFATSAQGTLADSSLQPVAVDYRGEYNNGDATYGIGAVVLYNELLYVKISNPNNAGYPPSGTDWELFEPLIGSPAYDLWVQTSLASKADNQDLNDYLPLAGGTMEDNAAIGWDNGSAIREAGAQGLEIECSVGYRWQWVAGRMILRTVNSGQIARILAIDGIAPTVTDDITAGFVPDTRWEMADGTVYLCTDSTEGAAVWIEAPVDHIPFDTAGGTLDAVGKVGWDADEETLAVALKDDVMLRVGEDVIYHVENNTASIIAKGAAVMYAGTVGNSGKLRVQEWDGTSTKAFLGFVREDIAADGGTGYVAHFGKAKGFATDGSQYSETWVSGDIIYAIAGSANLTNVTPTTGGYVIVAVVISAHASNGTLFVRPTQVPTASDIGALGIGESVVLVGGQGIYWSDVGTFPPAYIEAGGSSGNTYISMGNVEAINMNSPLLINAGGLFTDYINDVAYGLTAINVVNKQLIDNSGNPVLEWAYGNVYGAAFVGSGNSNGLVAAATFPNGLLVDAIAGYNGGSVNFQYGISLNTYGSGIDTFDVNTLPITGVYSIRNTQDVEFINGDARGLYDSGGYTSIDWGLRQLFALDGTTVLMDWGNINSSSIPYFPNGIALGDGQRTVTNYSTLDYYDGAAMVPRVDWAYHELRHSNGSGSPVTSLNWSNRQLLGTDGVTVMAQWSNGYYFEANQIYGIGGSIGIDYSQGALLDGSTSCLNWIYRQLLSPSGNTMLDWSDPSGYGIINVNGNHFMNVDNLADSSDVASVYVNNRSAVDSSGNWSIDWQNRQLLGTDGTTVQFDWNSYTPNFPTGIDHVGVGYIRSDNGFVGSGGNSAANLPYGATFNPNTVAGLIATEGTISYVNDADTPVIGVAVVGGGSAKCLVCYNGTDHIVTALL